MVNRDYAKEVGLSSAEKLVPLPRALAILAVAAVVGGAGFAALHALTAEPARSGSLAEVPAATHPLVSK
jgi:hypothetical protein